MQTPTVTRRQALTMACASVGAAGLGTPAIAVGRSRWSDTATWGGQVPRPGDLVDVTTHVELDVDVRVAGVRIHEGGSLTFSPSRDVCLESTGNVVVAGVLRMAPSSTRQRHILRFVNVDEGRFQGGGMAVRESEVGLWAVDRGELQLQGSRKTAWVNAAAAIDAGSTQLLLSSAPRGWARGDVLVVVPSGPGATHEGDYDKVVVTQVVGDRVTVDRPLNHDHPAVEAGGLWRGTEVLNLTRNVVVEGTPTGRTHVLVLAPRPQTIRFVTLRHFGPRQAFEKYTTPVLGRYGLHFHMLGDASIGSLVEGVVATAGGSHAFVPHDSNGISFRECISHDTFEDPYWWDARTHKTNDAPKAHGIDFEACVASLVKCDPDFRGYRLAGYRLGPGERNSVRSCVAVGIQGSRQSSGFHWPEGPLGLWAFSNCVSHNNRAHGIFIWQNSLADHVIEGLLAYRNGGAGISHGAYRNSFAFRDCALVGNASSGVELHALAHERSITFERLHIDAEGLSEFAVEVMRHKLTGTVPVSFDGGSFSNYQRAGFGFTADAGPAELLDVVNTRFDGNEFWFSDTVASGSRVRYQPAGQSRALLLQAIHDGTGRTNLEWNARVQPVPVMMSGGTPSPGKAAGPPSAKELYVRGRGRGRPRLWRSSAAALHDH